MSDPMEYTGPVYDRPPTIGEMVQEITEYEIENLSWGDIKGILALYYAEKLSSMPPEALQERYDSVFNRY
jgi:hypothetical protein